ncbi:MAG TPA: AAA family ATPase [Pirellulales bacterium]|nr:AAA family ATPase [Pirellulales bacterium]
MTDQANDLRKLIFRSPRANVGPTHAPPRLVVAASGKGGVGTTTLAVNLAAALARDGRRIVLVDADFQNADATKLCRVEASEGIADVLGGRRSVHEVLVRGPAGALLLPGAWGRREAIDSSQRAQQRLLDEINCLGAYFDFVVVDAGSTASTTMARFWSAAERIVLVTTPESMAVLDTYAMVKSLAEAQRAHSICTIVNRAASARTAEAIHHRLAQASRRFLGLRLEHIGHIGDDATVAAATAELRVLLEVAADSAAARQFEHVAQQLSQSLAAGTSIQQAA